MEALLDSFELLLGAVLALTGLVAGRWIERLNTDASVYGGSNVGNGGEVHAEPSPWQGRSASVSLTIPPLATLVFQHAG